MKLNKDNYYSAEAERNYLSYSQFKGFLECEAQELAIIEERYAKPNSDSLVQGGYVDAYFSHEMDDFLKGHPEMFKKDGTLLAKYDVCNEAIKAVEEDDTLKSMFFSGETQTILTGEIADVPFKGKIDMLYRDDKIVDMKFMKDVNRIWDEETRTKRPFYFYYGYHIQAAIYRELVRQATGAELPYYLAVLTKTDVVEKHVYQFNDSVLRKTLDMVKALAPRFQAIKKHEIEPKECGKCGYYHSTHKFDIFDIEEIKEEE